MTAMATTNVAANLPVAEQPVGGRAYPVKATDDSVMRGYFDRATYEQVYSVATMLAKSDLIPQHFKNKPENCFVAVQLAARMGMDPFMVMQNCYIVSGRPGFEAKFTIALINASGLFRDPLRYTFSGQIGKPDWTCTVSAVRAATGEICSLDFRYATAEAEGWVSKGGSKWKTMPEQMMRYRAAAFFARVYCPEVMMGMQSREELEDTTVEIIERPAMQRPRAVLPATVEDPQDSVEQVGPAANDIPPPPVGPTIGVIRNTCIEISSPAFAPTLMKKIGVDPKKPDNSPADPAAVALLESVKAFVSGLAAEDRPVGTDAWESVIAECKSE